MDRFTVKLSKSQAPRFPAACIRCHADAPAGHVRIWTSAIGWWTALFAFGALHRVDVPACAPCARRVALQRYLRFGATVACCVVGVALAGRVTSGIEGPLRKLATVALALAACVPWFAWQAFFPAVVDITAYESSVDYEFRSRDYAFDFAELNESVIEDE